MKRILLFLRKPVLAELLERRGLCRVLVLGTLLLVISSLLQLDWYACGFRSLFGIPCPGCGMTRSVKSLLQGDLHQSLAYHWFGPFALLLFLLMAIVSLTPISWSKKIAQRIQVIEAFFGCTQLIFLVLILYWLTRLFMPSQLELLISSIH